MGNSALIVVDMLNPYEHDDAELLTGSVEAIVHPLTRLIDRARSEDARVIYVNDNYGDWDSSAQRLSEAAMEGRRPDLVEPVLPEPGTPFVLKARHTIFYETPFEYLLRQEQVDRIVLAGQVTEQCILYSALDAYVRQLKVVVPEDTVAHIHRHLADAALEMMRTNMAADTTASEDVPL